MAKRKADHDLSSKYSPKKPAALGQQHTKPETPIAKAYRRKRAIKLAQTPAAIVKDDQVLYDVYSFPPTLPAGTSKDAQSLYDVYTFPSTLPSPPSLATNTPNAGCDDDPIVLEGDENACNDTQSAHRSPDGPVDIPEDTLFAILHKFPGVDLTETALDAIMQYAAAAAKPGDEFGIIFMRRFISRLAETPIEDEWLAKIVDLLQQNLGSLCDRVKCQIRSLGKTPLPSRRQPEVHADSTRSGVGVVKNSKTSSHTAKSKAKSKTRGATTKTTDGAEDSGKHTKQDRRKTKDTQQQKSSPAPTQSSPAQCLITPSDGCQEWQPNDGTSSYYVSTGPLDSVDALFTRSATDAHCFAADEDGKAIKSYGKRIRRIWARVEPEQRADWVKLFNARPDAVSPSVHGQRLLQSQGLLVKFLPKGCTRRHKH